MVISSPAPADLSGSTSHCISFRLHTPVRGSSHFPILAPSPDQGHRGGEASISSTISCSCWSVESYRALSAGSIACEIGDGTQRSQEKSPAGKVLTIPALYWEGRG